MPILNYLFVKTEYRFSIICQVKRLSYDLSSNFLDIGGCSTYSQLQIKRTFNCCPAKKNMKQIDKNITDPPGLNIMQKRSKKTYDALIKAGFKLLRKHSWDSITIAELSRAAGYSVGAFYARFNSKDEFFDVLIENQSQARKADYERLFSKLQNDDLLDELIKDIVQYFRNKCNFWRAAQVRSMRGPEFWEQIRQDGNDLASRFIERLSKQINRPLTDSEEINVRFAFQMVNGTINSAVINQPGPILLNQKLFIEKLIRAFRLISNYDNFKIMKKFKK